MSDLQGLRCNFCNGRMEGAGLEPEPTRVGQPGVNRLSHLGTSPSDAAPRVEAGTADEVIRA